jgi:hypothetical protein
MNIPTQLVNTWLTLATNNKPDFREVQEIAYKNLIAEFGTIELAKQYIADNKQNNTRNRNVNHC